MEKFINFCIHNRFLVIFGVLLLGVFGIRASQQLPIDAVPDVTNVQVQVLTNAPALGPVEVEQYVTVPVETVMSGLPHVKKVRSLSRFGLSAVTIVFEEGTDIFFARQMVSERLTEARASIPDGYGSPEMGPITSGLGEIYQFEVRAERTCKKGESSAKIGGKKPCYTLMELRSILDWYVSFQLRPIPGVVEVNSMGGELKTYEVQVDPDKLNGLALSLSDIFSALENNNANEGGGYIVSGGEQRVIRGEGLIRSLEDIRNVVIATRDDGAAIFVKDVADVAFAPLIRQGAVTRDGRGEVVTGTVMMLMGANSGDVSKAVKKRIEEISPGLPEGVSIDAYYDRSELVERTIQTVARNLIEGGVLVIIILLLLLGNIRGGLLVAAVIPLSLLGTFISMQFFNVSGNLMSLGALDFGLIIDGAIVVIENISRRLSESKAKGEKEVTEIVKSATKQVIRPVLFGTAIIMIVYIPILSLRGIEGKMFIPMAIAVLSALTVALVLAITMVPALSTWIYKKGLSEKEPWLAKQIRKAYEPLLKIALASRRKVLAGAAILLVGGIVLASTMGAEFIPTLDEGAIAMQAVRPPSVSLEESIEATGRIERVLKDAFPDEIDTVISKTGRAEIATDPMGVEVSDIYVMLHPIKDWKIETKAELVEAMEERLNKEVVGQNFSFSQPIELRTNELISGVRSDVAINIYGQDFAELEATGERVMKVLRSIRGSADVNADQVAGLPSLRIIVNRSAAARYGLNASEILDAVSAIGGRPVGTVFEGQRRFTAQVRLKPSARQDAQSLRSLLISAPGGKRVPLGQVAAVVLDEGPAVVSRETAQRRMTIQVNVRGRDLASFVAEAQEKVKKEANLPSGYFVKWGGQFENLQAATSRLMVAVPAALLLIFLLLFTTFGSFRPSLIIYMNIPMAAVGGVFALWIRGMPFSISAAIGFIALSGIAVLNGVVMVTYIRELQAEGLSLMDATEKGARLRLRAVMMTALTDGIGFLPMAISTGAGAEVQQPLATVVIGGLITATLLTLFVLPVVYSWLGGEVEGDDDSDDFEEPVEPAHA